MSLALRVTDVAATLELVRRAVTDGAPAAQLVVSIERCQHELEQIAAALREPEDRPSQKALQLLADWRECDQLLKSLQHRARDGRDMRAAELLPMLCREFTAELDAIKRAG